jgi:hypothetical protein
LHEKWEGSSVNENQRMHNEKTIIFKNEIEIERSGRN